MPTPFDDHRLECLRKAYLRLRDILSQDTHTQERLYDAYLDLRQQIQHPGPDRHGGERYRVLYEALRREAGR